MKGLQIYPGGSGLANAKSRQKDKELDHIFSLLTYLDQNFLHTFLCVQSTYPIIEFSDCVRFTLLFVIFIV